MTITTNRTEIADHVEDAFRNGPASRQDLLEEAVRTGAPPAVIDVLGRLTGGPYLTLRDLWPDLPGLPVERQRPASHGPSPATRGDTVGVQHSDRRL